MLAKKITWMMTSAIILTVIMVVSSVVWTAERNNRQAAMDSYMMLSGGIQGIQDTLTALNWDYAAWTAALTNSLDRNLEWLDENMGSGAGGGSFEIMQITWPEDWSSRSWNADSDGESSSVPMIPLNVVRRIHADLQQFELGTNEANIFGVEIDDGYYFLSAARIQAWQESSPISAEKLPVLIMGLSLDSARISEIGETYLIDDLTLDSEPTKENPSLRIQGIDGAPIAYFHWTPPLPGNALIRTASVPLGLALTLFFLLAGTVTILARRSARELMRREGESSRIARVDTLTGLPNRVAFNELLATHYNSGEDLAILFMDLNEFKAVNDEHGHRVGDALIAEIGKTVQNCKRREDFAARIGGDEFNLLFFGEGAAAACERFCHDLKCELNMSIIVEGITLHPKIAMGYSVGKPRNVQISELIHQADVAMYTAKNRKNREPLRYDPSIEADAKYEAQILAGLKDVLSDGKGFKIEYQPIFDVRTGGFKLAEALLRWHSRSMGQVSPATFIPIAEKSGLIVEIGDWVIKQVFSDMSKDPNLCVAINLSPLQLRSRTIVQNVRDFAESYGVSANRVTFEITEGMLVEEPDAAAIILDSLNDIGFKTALDDFGTGFSSIGYLRKFRFDKLKIDKSYVDDLGINDTSKNLMSALVHLAHSLDMEIVAEGVETEKQFELLKSMNCDFIQGYLLSRPLEKEDLPALRVEENERRQGNNKEPRSA